MNNLILLFIIVPLLAVLLLGLNFLLSPNKPDEAKLSIYECGFQTIPGQTRSTFQIHFYIVGLLFLIFDLEILLLFPISVTLSKVSTYGFSIAMIFLVILTVGFILEIGIGAISLDKLNVKTKDTSNPLKLNKYTILFNLKQLSSKNLNKTIINKLNKPRKVKYMFILPFLSKILNKNKNNNFKIKSKSFIIGIKHGYSVSTLPSEINELHNRIYIRVLRVIGGISVILIISRRLEYLGDGWLYLVFLSICVIFSLLFSIYLMYINYYRINNIYKILKSDKINVKTKDISKPLNINKFTSLSNLKSQFIKEFKFKNKNLQIRKYSYYKGKYNIDTNKSNFTLENLEEIQSIKIKNLLNIDNNFKPQFFEDNLIYNTYLFNRSTANKKIINLEREYKIFYKGIVFQFNHSRASQLDIYKDIFFKKIIKYNENSKNSWLRIKFGDNYFNENIEEFKYVSKINENVAVCIYEWINILISDENDINNNVTIFSLDNLHALWKNLINKQFNIGENIKFNRKEIFVKKFKVIILNEINSVLNVYLLELNKTNLINESLDIKMKYLFDNINKMKQENNNYINLQNIIKLMLIYDGLIINNFFDKLLLKNYNLNSQELEIFNLLFIIFGNENNKIFLDKWKSINNYIYNYNYEDYEDNLIKSIIYNFPFYKKLKNVNIESFLGNIYKNKFLINNYENMINNKKIELELVFFLDGNNNIDYDSIYLIENLWDKKEVYYLNFSSNLKLNNNKYSKRTINIINKYFLMEITKILKDKYHFNIGINKFVDNFNYENFNLVNLINEVKPNSPFFTEPFKPYFKDISLGDEDILVDFKNKNNKIEKFNLFQKKFS